MRSGKPKSYSVREVPWEGEVGAGRLLPFVPKDGTVPVAVPDNIPENEPLGTMTVRGRSLENVGIYDGDVVLCRKLFHRSKIRRDTVCIVYIPSQGEVNAKKITFRENTIVLRSCGGGVPDLYVPPDDVEIRGIVIGMTRHRTEWPYVSMVDDEIPL